MPFSQRHLAENVLAALTAYDASACRSSGRRTAQPRSASSWRGEVRELPGGGLVVNDAYSANPTSMRAALLDLAERAAGRRRVAILGQMAELGDESDRYHGDRRAARPARDRARRRGRRAARRYLAGVEQGVVVSDAGAVGELLAALEPGDAILVKGSRSVGLEGIPALIEKHSRAWSES